MSKKAILILAIVLVFAAGGFFFYSKQQKKKKDDADKKLTDEEAAKKASETVKQLSEVKGVQNLGVTYGSGEGGFGGTDSGGSNILGQPQIAPTASAAVIEQPVVISPNPQLQQASQPNVSGNTGFVGPQITPQPENSMINNTVLPPIYPEPRQMSPDSLAAQQEKLAAEEAAKFAEEERLRKEAEEKKLAEIAAQQAAVLQQGNIEAQKAAQVNAANNATVKNPLIAPIAPKTVISNLKATPAPLRPLALVSHSANLIDKNPIMNLLQKNIDNRKTVAGKVLANVTARPAIVASKIVAAPVKLAAAPVKAIKKLFHF